MDEVEHGNNQRRSIAEPLEAQDGSDGQSDLAKAAANLPDLPLREFTTPTSQNMLLYLTARRLRELIWRAVFTEEPNPCGCILRRPPQLAIKMSMTLAPTCGFMLSHTIFLTLSRDNLAPALGLIQAPTTSPYFLHGTLMTAASRTDGCDVSAFSICTGNRFSPPRMMISYGTY